MQTLTDPAPDENTIARPPRRTGVPTGTDAGPGCAARTDVVMSPRSGPGVGPHPVASAGWPEIALAIQHECAAATRFAVLGAAWTRALAQRLGADQATLSWRRRNRLRLVAGAPLAPARFSAGRRRAILLSMDEACDQQVSLTSVEPPPGAAASLHIVLAQRALARRFDTRQSLVISVPLPHGHETVGALNLVWTGQAAQALAAEPARLLEMLERHAPAMTQALRLAHAAERPWPARIGHRLRHSPRERRRRVSLGAVLALVVCAALLTPFERQVNLDARLQGAIERQVAAPDDGSLAHVHVRPGDRVRAGSVLATLTDRDLRLERDRLLSELARHQGRADAAMAAGDRTELAIAQSLVAQTNAQLARHEARLSETRVRAPIDGVILDGEIWQLEGTPVSRGQALFTLAPEHAYRVVIDVDEAQRVRVAPGRSGVLRVQGIDGGALPFTIERISPVAVEREDSVVFEAHAGLRADHPDLRAGMRGVAQVAADSASLLGRWTERARQRVQLLWWRWQP